MRIAFDLISDLHVETWQQPFTWEGQATSPYAIIAGDIARDPTVLENVLTELAQNYLAVFYIDGNDEHRWTLNNTITSYQDIDRICKNIQDLVYLQDNVVVVDGVGILGTNGWWDYSLDPEQDFDQCVLWCADRYQITVEAAVSMAARARIDSQYMISSVKKLQQHQDVKRIIMVTHTVPAPFLVDHDLELVNTHRINTTGNSQMLEALKADTENKIVAWCFGHYHNDVDQIKYNCRWVSNPRGRGDTKWSKQFYYPKRIEVEI